MIGAAALVVVMVLAPVALAFCWAGRRHRRSDPPTLFTVPPPPPWQWNENYRSDESTR